MPKLTIHGPAGPPVGYRVDGDAVTVGRSAGADLTIADPTLSRLHAELGRAESGWVVSDRGSRNGTRVNGRRVGEEARLKDGDRIAIGETVLVFHEAVDEGGPAESAEPPTRTIALEAGDDEIIGRSAAIVGILRAIDRVAPTTATVLITGENGTGKELVARRIHRRSGREGPLVVVNCPALPGPLLESELFGVERGVATGVDARAGLFESADGGSLLLDEIGDMETTAQARLLRVLQERAVTRVGGRAPIAVDARVIAATHHDLEADVARGSFRRDLYHRLEVVRLRIPPLRERREDIPLLAAFALSRPGPAAELASETVELLERHDYPGNVRELLHAVERARLFAEDGVVRPEHLPDAFRRARESGGGSAASQAGAVADGVDRLYERLSAGEVSFWEAVRDPFLTRELSRDDARRLIARAYGECGRSYKRVAARFGLAGRDYKRLLNFLRNHDLRVDS